jgi:hypothetical protein
MADMVAEELKGTRKLYESLWSGCVNGMLGHPSAPAVATVACLTQLATVFDRKLSPELLESYTASLETLSRPQIIQAFSRAQDECHFWPVPAKLLELSGQVAHGDPIEYEANREMLALFAQMREFGPRLSYRFKPGTPENMGPPPEEARIYPKRLSTLTEAALQNLGWGDRLRGLMILSDHPGMRYESASSAFVTNGKAAAEYRWGKIQQADEIRKRWVVAFREAKVNA